MSNVYSPTNISDLIEVLENEIYFLEDLQTKARSIGAHTKLQDRVISLMNCIEFCTKLKTKAIEAKIGFGE